MKKLFLVVAVFAGALLFSSCGDDPLQEMFELVSGKSSVTVGDDYSDEFSTSIAMFGEAETPYVLGMSMEIDVNKLIASGSVEEIDYPFMCYRFVGDNLKKGATLTVNNVLTDEDLVNFDYRSMLNGEFAANQVVGYAISDHEFYIMSTGSIHLTKVSKTKVVGNFEGKAYYINMENIPMLSEDLVDISGSFKSRVVPMMKWLKDLQEQTDEEKF